MMDSKLLRVTEAARMAGIGRTLAYQFVHAGTWPSVKIGRVVRVPKSALDNWIAQQEQAAEENAARFRGENY